MTSKTGHKLEGIIPAVITPFDEKGAIQEKDLQKQVEYLLAGGSHGFFVNGTTGEGGHLTTEEKLSIHRLVKEVTGGKVFLCDACIQPSTEMVVEEVKAFEKVDPDYIVAVTPYYYDASQEVIFRHFRAVAEAASAPVIIYNIPSRTHNPIDMETVRRLADIDNIAGMKDSTGNFVSFSMAMLSDFPPQFTWIQGEDLVDGPSLIMGADGLVTGLSNILIDPYVKMFDAARAGNVQEVLDCQRTVNKLAEVIFATGGKVNPAIKAAVALLGRGTRWMRTASMSLGDEDVSRVRRVLEEMKLL